MAGTRRHERSTRRAQRRAAAALLFLGALGAGATGGRTVADFSAAAVNPGNNFSAAATFGSTVSATAAVAKASPTSTPYSSTVLADSPIAYWRFGEPAGSTTAADATGHGHDGSSHSLYGPQRGLAGAIGDGDTAVQWTYSDSDVEVPHHDDLRLNGAFSMELWVRLDAKHASASSRLLFDKGGSPDVNGWRIEYNQAGSLLFMRNTTSVASATGVMSVGGFKHVAVTYDGATLRWYVNGALSTSTAITYPASVGTGIVRFVPIGLPFGEVLEVDDAAVYGSALSATQVHTHFTEGRRFVADPCATYRVYANATDLGSPPSGITSVAADVSALTTGATAVPLVAGSYNVGGVAYGYRSAPQRAEVQPGSYPYSVTSVDGAGAHTQAGLTATVDTPPAVTSQWLTGSEYGLVQTPDLFSSTFNGLIDATAARTGSYSLRLNKTATGMAYAAKMGFTAQTSLTFAVRLAALPVADVTSLAYVNAVTTPLYVGYRAIDQKLTLRWGAGAAVVASPVVTAGTWYAIDLKVDSSVNPNTASWQVDGVDQGTATSAAAAQGVLDFRFGSVVATDVFTANYDDIMHSRSLLDYPLGPVKVRTLRPDGMGTHSSPADFQHEDGSPVSASTYARLDESPTNQIGDGGVRQIAEGSGASYLEMTIENTSQACVRGVQALSAQHKTSSQANTMKTSVFSGTAERVVHSGDSTGTNVTSQKTAPIAPVTTPWTPSELNGLVFRIGYSTDINPQPYWDALLVEYASTG